MNFDEAHSAFLKRHIARRTGERKGRLERGHSEAEQLFCRNVWWRLWGNFDNLHPEYEILDWRGVSYFCDFVWMSPSVQLIIEIKGFGPHVRDMDRQKYCNELNRETFLTAMGYSVISFSYDDVAYRPDLCVTLLRMVISRFSAEASHDEQLIYSEREIIRLAYAMARPLRPVDVQSSLGTSHRKSVRLLQALCDKRLLTPITGEHGRRITRYELVPGAKPLL
ncbi:DUF559 domain-containing protein [Paenibacillus sp. NPDC058071]|uniref:DUF559 domain-containing protein n=1 Tax=Paenibacillus sp. NPDC058071 TaxID=3346326 RepID=UPI0036DBB34A